MRIALPPIVCGALLALPAFAVAQTYRIQYAPGTSHDENGAEVETPRLTRIGPLRLGGNPTLRQARRVFGRPSHMRREYGVTGCVVDWQRIGLRINFANYGGRDACDPRYGKVQTFSVRKPAIVTWNGLRVGMSSARIAELHPTATYKEDSWWIRHTWTPLGDSGYAPILKANVSGGKVVSLVGSVGAAGE